MKRLRISPRKLTALLCIAVGAAALGACSRDDLPATSLSFASQAGDYVGQGATVSYASDKYTVSVSGTTADLSLRVSSGGTYWTAEIAAPRGATLHQGSYGGAVRAVSRVGTQPGLDIYGDGRGCNTLTGSFQIYEIKADANGAITQLDAVAIQHCEGATPAMTAALRYNATPMNVSLVSDAGDYVGAGMSKYYDGDTSQFSVQSYGVGGVNYSVSGLGDNWRTIITPPTGGTLTKGVTYATRRFADATHAGLDFFGNGRGCNNSSGTLTVNELKRDGAGAMTAMNLTLEQHCENATPALHVTIRYNA